MTYFIYIVKLVNSKYFVSLQKSSIDFKKIIYEGQYPIELIQVIELEKINKNIEIDKIVKEYMIKYGIDKVRGGSYNKQQLDDLQILILEYEFAFIKNNNINNNNINIDDIDIDIISNICDNIHDYQNKINSTNIIIDIDELLKTYKINTDLNNRIKFLYTCIDNYHYNGSIKSGCSEMVKKLHNQIEDIDHILKHHWPHETPYSNLMLDTYKGRINNCYKSYCKFNNIEPKACHNFEIQYYLIKIYNNKQKQLLKEFIDKNGSLDDNMKKLIAFHKMKYNLL
jgi:hypothetical protein